ncbi:hypothetical protein V8E54_011051 [Elaphomyces granulatus]
MKAFKQSLLSPPISCFHRTCPPTFPKLARNYTPQNPRNKRRNLELGPGPGPSENKEWTAVLLQTFKTQVNPTDYDLKRAYAGLSAAVSVKINRQSKAIGNGDGTSLLELHEKRRVEISEQRRVEIEQRCVEIEQRCVEIEQRRLEIKKQWLIQLSQLNQWSRVHDPVLKAIRNNCVHGGDVVADIKVIENYGSDQNDGGKGWRNAFKRAYGVSLDDIRGKDVPMEFYYTLNRRASMIHLLAWKKGRDTKRDTDREEIERLCKRITQAWKDEKADLLKEKSESLGWFKQLETIWRRWEPR